MSQYERESNRNRPGSVPSPISLVFGAMNMYLVAKHIIARSGVLAVAGRCWPPTLAQKWIQVARSPTGMV